MGHLCGHEPTEEDFNNADANGDGKCTVDEVHAYIMSFMANGRSLNREFYFSNDASVEARVRIIGCACDLDGDFMISQTEVNEEVCVFIQHWLFDHNLSQDEFEMVDQNNDGNIDGNEAAQALEHVEAEASG